VSNSEVFLGLVFEVPSFLSSWAKGNAFRILVQLLRFRWGSGPDKCYDVMWTSIGSCAALEHANNNLWAHNSEIKQGKYFVWAHNSEIKQGKYFVW
jgi:hypothetical protein